MTATGQVFMPRSGAIVSSIKPACVVVVPTDLIVFDVSPMSNSSADSTKDLFANYATANATIKIHNPTQEAVVFKLKSNASNALLRVNPNSSGLIPPYHEKKLSVVMRFDKTDGCLDAVHMLVVTAPISETNLDADPKVMWSRVVKSQISYKKLRCIFNFQPQDNDVWEMLRKKASDIGEKTNKSRGSHVNTETTSALKKPDDGSKPKGPPYHGYRTNPVQEGKLPTVSIGRSKHTGIKVMPDVEPKPHAKPMLLKVNAPPSTIPPPAPSSTIPPPPPPPPPPPGAAVAGVKLKTSKLQPRKVQEIGEVPVRGCNPEERRPDETTFDVQFWINTLCLTALGIVLSHLFF